MDNLSLFDQPEFGCFRRLYWLWWFFFSFLKIEQMFGNIVISFTAEKLRSIYIFLTRFFFFILFFPFICIWVLLRKCKLIPSTCEAVWKRCRKWSKADIFYLSEEGSAAAVNFPVCSHITKARKLNRTWCRCSRKKFRLYQFNPSNYMLLRIAAPLCHTTSPMQVDPMGAKLPS